ncbi:hypothetical protein CerSpe_227230 [Prunus speciosa]
MALNNKNTPSPKKKNKNTNKLVTNDVVLSSENDVASTIQKYSVPSSNSSNATLGSYLARRLLQIGVTDVFSVPGDFNLTLLYYLIAEPGLANIGCCNELNAGYAADGYARSRGRGRVCSYFHCGWAQLAECDSWSLQ